MAVGHSESVDAIAQNLANCNTPGYRKLQVSQKLFDTLLNNAQMPMTRQSGEAFSPLSVNFAQGPMQPTDRPLDFAIHGDGFFVVAKDGQNYYTRKGNFAMNSEGNLTTADGDIVQGSTGPINFPPDTVLAELKVGDDGTLLSGTRILDKLKVVKFQNNDQLDRAGNTLFQAPDSVQPEDAGAETKVANRTLEHSNTSVAEEMADLIKTMRNYEACQRMIRNDDEKTGKMIQQMS